jgi:hypothetical protein
MARTYKADPPRWYSKEKKAFRHPHYQAYRAASKMDVRMGRDPEPYRRTSGWLTH